MQLIEAQRHAAKLCDWLRPHCEPKTGRTIIVAGSIRRLRPSVNDIDLVCIPKITEQKDLLGNVICRQIPMLDFLASYIHERNPMSTKAATHPHFISGDPASSGVGRVTPCAPSGSLSAPGRGNKGEVAVDPSASASETLHSALCNLTFSFPASVLPKQTVLWLPKIQCQVDLWFADESTFATRLLCRTGSKEHNIWLAQRAQKLNGHWDPYEGITINRARIPIPMTSDPAIGEECIYGALDLQFIAPPDREAPQL